MKYCLSLLLFLFIFSSVDAQKLRVTESHGEVFKIKGRSILDVFESSDGGYWSISVDYRIIRKNKYFGQLYDNKMNLISQKEISFKIDKKHYQMQKIVRFQKEYYIFLTLDDVEKDKKKLFFTTFDPYDLTIAPELTEVASLKLMHKQKLSSRANFDISVSDNENFVVVFGNKAVRAKNRKRTGLFKASKSTDVGTHKFKFTYWVLNDKLENVNYKKNHTLTIENSTDKFYVRDFSVDDNGSIYILGKNAVIDYLSRKERRKKKTKDWVEYNESAFILEKINVDGESQQYTSASDTLYLDMDLLFDNEGNVNLLGLTGKQYGSSLAATGVSRVVLNPRNLETRLEASAGFDTDIIKEVNNLQEGIDRMNKRRQKRLKKKEARMSDEKKERFELAKNHASNIGSITFSEIDDMGNAVVVLEEYYVHVVTTTTTDAQGRTTTTTTYYYHYDDLILVKFIEDSVRQNYYKKSYTSVNVPLRKSMDVVVNDDAINIMTQGHIVRADYDLSNVRDYELKSFKRKDRIPGMRNKMFRYRKAMDENTLLAPARNRRKVAWYKIKVQ